MHSQEKHVIIAQGFFEEGPFFQKEKNLTRDDKILFA